MNRASLHVETLRWEGGLPGRCTLIEQTLLPLEERWLAVESVPAMHDAIRRLAVRGAPAIGVAAGYGVVLGVQQLRDRSGDEVLRAALEAADHLANMARDATGTASWPRCTRKRSPSTPRTARCAPRWVASARDSSRTGWAS